MQFQSCPGFPHTLCCAWKANMTRAQPQLGEIFLEYGSYTKQLGKLGKLGNPRTAGQEPPRTAEAHRGGGPEPPRTAKAYWEG